MTKQINQNKNLLKCEYPKCKKYGLHIADSKESAILCIKHLKILDGLIDGDGGDITKETIISFMLKVTANRLKKQYEKPN